MSTGKSSLRIWVAVVSVQDFDSVLAYPNDIIEEANESGVKYIVVIGIRHLII